MFRVPWPAMPGKWFLSYSKSLVSYSMTATSAACSPKFVMPKLAKEIVMYGAACSAVRHSPAAGALAQEALAGSTLMMSAAVMTFSRLKGDAKTPVRVAESAHSAASVVSIVKAGFWRDWCCRILFVVVGELRARSC